jgi:hypothetical protein
MRPEKIWDPSRGGIGIILNTAKEMLTRVNLKNIVIKMSRLLPINLKSIPPTKANHKLDAGPANAIFIISIRGLAKYRESTGTGLAHPKPTKRIINDPYISK